MPSSRILISSQTLASSAASVTFSSIPATYTDLVVKVSGRTTIGVPSVAQRLRFNGLSTAIYSYTEINGDGSTPTSVRVSGGTETPVVVNGATSTADTFSNTEIYIPNYTSTVAKQISVNYVAEDNAASAQIGAVASLINLTAAITSIEISFRTFVTGSSFYLYGIKNS